MMKKMLISLVMIAAVTGIAFAADTYRMEGGLGFDYLKEEDSWKTSTYNGVFTYYFAPVNTASGPLYEAAFLQKASYVTAEVQKSIGKADGAKSSGYNLGIASQILIPSTPITALLGVTYIHDKFTNDGASDDLKTTVYSFTLGVGAYLMDDLHVGLEYSRDKTKYSPKSYEIPTYSTNHYTLDAKYVAKLNDMNAIALEGVLTYSKDTGSDPEKVKELEFTADFYVMPQLGIGGRFVNTDSNADENDTRTYGVRVIGFPMNSLCLEAGYNKIMAVKSSGIDGNNFYAEAGYRF
jgi:hypothetical protein